jgi:hypothetical protein
MVTATGASIPLYIDGGFDFNYNPYSNEFYIGYNNGGSVYTDIVVGRVVMEVGNPAAGMYDDGGQLAIGDFNGNERNNFLGSWK